MRGWWRAVQETRGSGWGVRRWFLSHSRSSRGWGRAAACPMRTGRWSHLSAGLGCPCVGGVGSGARGLLQCPDRRLSRRPVAVPGDPAPYSRSCIPTSFPAQKIGFPPLKALRPCPCLSFHCSPALPSPSSPCCVGAQQWRWKFEHKTSTRRDGELHLCNASCWWIFL